MKNINFRVILEELDNVLCLFSYPIQGLLAVMRLCKHYENIDSNIFRKLSESGSLSRKLAMFATAASPTERMCLLSEFPHLLKHMNVPPLRIPTLGVKRGAKDNSDDESIHKKARRVENKERVEGVVDIATDNLGFVSYSESDVWTKQQKFYENRGAEAWSRGEVPHQISSNSFVADMYVNMIIQMADRHLYNMQEQRIDKQVDNFKDINGNSSGNGSSSSSRGYGNKDIHLNGSDCQGNNTNRDNREQKENFCSNNNSTNVTDDTCITKKNVRIAVVEVGAGHGLLSFLMARKLKELLARRNGGSNDVNKTRCTTSENGDESNKMSFCNKNFDKSDDNYSPGLDVTIICTDFHHNVFDSLMLLPWIR
jgi:hypothetical protein